MHHHTSRRAFLISSVAGVTLATFGVPVSTLSAAEVAAALAPDLASYKPSFLTADEMRAVIAMSDRFIPADDEGPGALDTNVPIFIDQQLDADLGAEWYLKGPFEKKADPLMGYQLPYRAQEIYRIGLKLLDEHCRKIHNAAFADLSTTDKDAVLTSLQKNEVDFQAMGEEYLSASSFFGQVLSDTKNGYLADPMYGGNKGMASWKMIGFPGARASYTEWVTQHNVKYPLGPVSIKGERA
ncbi:gluconate 2-dehydrogenase subunit 3 family protein [Rhizobium sp. 768_B6_N1_8]|jgi:gluconate 2-dehydrogenase gamma chain|uniref:gluconate 2-dehydrogenase subunit 3 family protein n=1 Tax=unclassified Rhizobium TaxID=2613769 RepID=UPI003F235D5D